MTINIDPIPLVAASITKLSTRPGWRAWYANVDELSEGLAVPFPVICGLIWQLREHDLQKNWSLQTIESRHSFLGWCLTHGLNEYRALLELSDWLEELTKPAILNIEQDEFAGFMSKAMLLVANFRSDLNLTMANKSDRIKFCQWFLLEGIHGLSSPLNRLSDWQLSWLCSESPIAGLNHLQFLFFSGLDTDEQVSVYSDFPKWKKEFSDFFLSHQGLLKALRSTVNEHPGLPYSESVDTESKRPFGVNIIGHAFGQLGVGEDSRMAFNALQAAGISTSIRNFSPGVNIPQNDFELADHVTPHSRYSINLFCLTVPELARCFLEMGKDWFDKYHNIVYCPWELPDWPKQWEHLTSLADEIWLSSKHTFDSLKRANLPSPLYLMPMAVALPDGYFEAKRKARDEFKLPKSTTLYLFIFDINSSVKRKNPYACIQAFQHAFPLNQNKQVGLVLKTQTTDYSHPDLLKLREIQKQDPRLILLNEVMDKRDLLALYECCDCFVSLHRAEGYGRCIAEAMLLAKPVICTNWSGSLDFANAKTALPVEFSLQRITKGDYPFGENSFWAEANIESAATYMKMVNEQEDQVREIALSGQRYVLNTLNFDAVGKRYHQHFQVSCSGR